MTHDIHVYMYASKFDVLYLLIPIKTSSAKKPVVNVTKYIYTKKSTNPLTIRIPLDYHEIALTKRHTFKISLTTDRFANVCDKNRNSSPVHGLT